MLYFLCVSSINLFYKSRYVFDGWWVLSASSEADLKNKAHTRKSRQRRFQ